MVKADIPTFTAYMNPLIQVLKDLGGSGTIAEIDSRVADISGISDEQAEVLHRPDKGSQTEFEYRVAWTRTYLKKYGLIENSSRGVWSLTPLGRKTEKVYPREVQRYVREQFQEAQTDVTEDDSLENGSEEVSVEDSWRGRLMEILLNMEPSAFERLAQRLLRESGFIQVEVTGKSGDGGIDGKGIMRLGGLIGFRVIFQCKRYQGSVTAGQVRDFRGAMVGRADKGLIITTGNFTRGAMEEAIRDGAPAIDLIDGDLLMDKMKELGLGVKTEMVEKITVNDNWFRDA